MSKSSSNGSTWGCLIVIILIMIVMGTVKGCNTLVDKVSFALNEKTVEEQAQIVLEFERQTYEIDGTVSAIGKEVAAEFMRVGEDANAYFDLDLINRAEAAYSEAGDRYELIEIPKGLSEKRYEKLKVIKEEFDSVYTSKWHAMYMILKWSAEGDPSHLNDAMYSSTLAQDSMFEAIAELVTLKKELGVGDVVVTK